MDPACCHQPLRHAAFLAVVAGLWAGLPLSAQEADALKQQELGAAVKLLQSQVAELQQELEQEKARHRELIDSLASAVQLSEEQVVATREMQLKLQAFGVDLFTKEENSLEQRLLKAVRDLDIAQQDVERYEAALHQLSEEFLKFLGSQKEVSEGARKNAESAIQKATTTIAETKAQNSVEESTGISAARIVSVDAGIGLIVIDAGRRQGLRVGTPVSVNRDEKMIYTAMVVDVRDSVAGALLQEKITDVAEVVVGDDIKLLPNQQNL